jgi:hypothetical protein
MQSAKAATQGSQKMVWTGWILSGLITVFMLFDATIKIMRVPAALEGTARLGYPVNVVMPLGIVLLACTVLYAIPRTAILGAILLTGYLGGAVASNVRVDNPLLGFTLFPVYVGVLLWLGVFLRDRRVRELIPLRS